jgi:DNA-binding LytR/AlgR family response regulator
LRLLERQLRVDLLFSDVVLPGGLTGAQVGAQARAMRPGLKVLFTTGYARNAIIHHGRLDKGVHLITKPFSLNDLAAKIRDVLDAPGQPDGTISTGVAGNVGRIAWSLPERCYLIPRKTAKEIASMATRIARSFIRTRLPAQPRFRQRIPMPRSGAVGAGSYCERSDAAV